jgi:VanZ family protein
MMRTERDRYIKVLFWLTLVASYLLAVLPRDDVPKLTPFGDKSNHLLAFGVLTVLLLQAYRLHYTKAFGWMLLYGIFIEISQLFAINRSSELLDVVADSLGSLLGITIVWFARKYRIA